MKKSAFSFFLLLCTYYSLISQIAFQTENIASNGDNPQSVYVEDINTSHQQTFPQEFLKWELYQKSLLLEADWQQQGSQLLAINATNETDLMGVQYVSSFYLPAGETLVLEEDLYLFSEGEVIIDGDIIGKAIQSGTGNGDGQNLIIRSRKGITIRGNIQLSDGGRGSLMEMPLLSQVPLSAKQNISNLSHHQFLQTLALGWSVDDQLSEAKNNAFSGGNGGSLFLHAPRLAYRGTLVVGNGGNGIDGYPGGNGGNIALLSTALYHPEDYTITGGNGGHGGHASPEFYSHHGGDGGHGGHAWALVTTIGSTGENGTTSGAFGGAASGGTGNRGQDATGGNGGTGGNGTNGGDGGEGGKGGHGVAGGGSGASGGSGGNSMFFSIPTDMFAGDGSNAVLTTIARNGGNGGNGRGGNGGNGGIGICARGGRGGLGGIGLGGGGGGSASNFNTGTAGRGGNGIGGNGGDGGAGQLAGFRGLAGGGAGGGGGGTGSRRASFFNASRSPGNGGRGADNSRNFASAPVILSGGIGGAGSPAGGTGGVNANGTGNGGNGIEGTIGSLGAIISCPTLSIAVTSQAAENGTNGVFTITTNNQFPTATTVNVTISGTATAGTDYATMPTTFTFPANSNTATLLVGVIDDNLVEENETVTITLVAGTNYTVGTPNNATVNISDNDVGTLSIIGADYAAEDAVNGWFRVITTNPFATERTVNLTFDGTATADADYTALPTTLTFPADSLITGITVFVLADELVEDTETIIATLGAGTGYTVGTPNPATVTINDNDQSFISITATTDAAEDGTNGAFTLRATQQFPTPRTVNLTISGTATAGTDYTTIPTTFTFPANTNMATMDVIVQSDNSEEGDETVIATLEPGTGYASGVPSAATVNISDDDIVLDIAATTQAAEDVTTGLFTITASQAFATERTVNLVISGTAEADTDYTALPTTFTFPANSLSATIPVVLLIDALVEGNETVIATLDAGSGYKVGTSNTATVNISDDDTGILSIEATTQAEEDVINGLFTVTTSNQFSTPQTVNIVISGTATAGTDYTTIPTTLTFPADSVTTTIDVVALTDNLVEGDETVIVTLSTGVGYTVGTPNPATLIISDDDIGTLSIAATTQAAEDATDGLFTIITSNQFATPTTVNLITSGDAIAGTDYLAIPTTLVFPANSSTITIPVVVQSDAFVEGDELVVVTLDAGTGYSVGAPTAAEVIISDNDGGACLSDISSGELGSPITPGLFTAAATITTDGLVEDGTSVILTAGISITLENGFHAIAGSNFEALIENCDLPLSSSLSNRENISEPSKTSPFLTPSQAPSTLKIYPNPVTTETQVNFYLPQEQEVALYLFDQSGRLVRELLKNNVKSAGEYAVRIDDYQLYNGVFYVILQSADYRLVEKLVVMKND